MPGPSWRAWLVVGLLALAAIAARAITRPRAPLAEAPVELTVGERRALVTQDSDRARVVPAELADVTRLGPRSVVLTPRQAGSGRLVLGDGTRFWDVPLDVTPRVIEAFKEDFVEVVGDVQQAPPPFRLERRVKPRALALPVRP